MQATAGAPLSAQQHTSDDGTEASARPRRSLFWAVLALATAWVGLDQLVKVWAEATLTPGEPVPVVGELLQLRLVYNPGAAFSMATNATALLTVLATAVSGYIIWSARRLGSRGWAVGLGLLLGGAVGNLVDRLVRAPGPGRGHVVDMFALPNFPVFNVADIGITCAAVIIALLALRGIGPDGSRAGKHRPEERASE